ncbi:MAG: DUF397 domain-containing protein [Streptosporangiaceae bacterium]
MISPRDGASPVKKLSTGELTGARWQKSRRSNSQGACVELARLADGGFAVRNSRFPQGPVLRYTQAELRALIEGVKEGDFDHLLR